MNSTKKCSKTHDKKLAKIIHAKGEFSGFFRRVNGS